MIRAELLTPDAFAPFGNVIEVGVGESFDINDGYTTRHNALASVETDAEAIISIFEGRVRPLTVGMLECHPKGSQAFVPLNGQDWLVVVAQDPKPESCRAFLCKGNQGVQYGTSIWHHPLLVLNQPQNFLVVDRAGPGDNLQEVFFDDTLKIML
jgi:ureidoglycolate lyase